MLHNDDDMKKWKNEQINYFRKYLNNFHTDSKEYKTLCSGIKELEKTL